MRRIKQIFLLSLMLALSGCWLVYKPDIRQGNLIEPKNVDKIKVGMSVPEVIQIMGYPVMVNPFPDNRLIYVYSLQPGHGEFMAKQLIIYFAEGRVTNYSTAGHYP